MGTAEQARARAVPFVNGGHWFVCGWRLFMKNPGLWIGLGLIYAVVTIVLSLVPFAGELVLYLIAPALAGGFLYSARELERGNAMELAHLVRAFQDRDRMGPMLILGAVLLVALLVIGVIALLLVGATAGLSMAGAEGPPPAPEVTLQLLLALLVALALSLPVAMAYFYAIPLVMLEGAAPLQALQSSVQACLRNILPLLLFSIIYTVAFILAAIPFFLGFLLLIPLSFAAWYCSYVDIYAPDTGATATGTETTREM